VLFLTINPAQFLANYLEYTVVLVDSFRISSLGEGSVQGYHLQREALKPDRTSSSPPSKEQNIFAISSRCEERLRVFIQTNERTSTGDPDTFTLVGCWVVVAVSFT